MINIVDTRIVEALKDYRYLLNRGYPQKPALDLVVTRYMLSRTERLILYRCIHSASIAKSIRSRIVCRANNKTLVLDFYNILLTMLALIEGTPCFICDDCIVRDIRGSKLRDKEKELFLSLFDMLIEMVYDLGYEDLILVLDKSISFSAHHANVFRSLSYRKTIVHTVLADKTDKAILRICENKRVDIATSDIMILTKAPQHSNILNLVMLFASRYGLLDKLYDISRYLDEESCSRELCYGYY